MSEKKHIYYFDYLRIFAFVCVVYMHVAATILMGPVTAGWKVLNVLTSTAFCAVPLFFMMSGYLLTSSSKSGDIKVLFKNRLPRLVVPTVFWSLVAVAVLMMPLPDKSIGLFATNAFNGLFKPVIVHLWFMYTLISFYMLSPLICPGLRAASRSVRIYLVVLMLVSLAVWTVFVLVRGEAEVANISVHNQILIFDKYIVSFILGYILGTTEKRIPNLLLVFVALINVAVITVGTYYITIAKGTYTPTFQSQNGLFEVLLAASVFLLAKQNLNRTTPLITRLATPAAALSFSIYLSHNTILRLLSNLGYAPKDAFQVMIYTVLLGVGCYLLLKTAGSIKPLSFLFTGSTYKQACSSFNWQYTFGKKK